MVRTKRTPDQRASIEARDHFGESALAQPARSAAILLNLLGNEGPGGQMRRVPSLTPATDAPEMPAPEADAHTSS